MFFEKIKINLRIFQMRPTFHDPGMIIQVDDLCPRERQQEGRMGADDQLVPAVPDRFCEEISQDQLVLRTQAVFRLVQQAQGIHFDLALEMHEGAFPVGPLPQALAGFILNEPAHGFAAGLVNPVQMIQVVQ